MKNKMVLYSYDTTFQWILELLLENQFQERIALYVKEGDEEQNTLVMSWRLKGY